MDLSTRAKNRRDAVEDPLFRISGLIDKLEQIHTRMSAAIKVWPEIGRTLNPAMQLLDLILNDMKKLKAGLAQLWQEGFEVNWK
jgi:hypothetical protein